MLFTIAAAASEIGRDWLATIQGHKRSTVRLNEFCVETATQVSRASPHMIQRIIGRTVARYGNEHRADTTAQATRPAPPDPMVGKEQRCKQKNVVWPCSGGRYKRSAASAWRSKAPLRTRPIVDSD